MKERSRPFTLSANPKTSTSARQREPRRPLKTLQEWRASLEERQSFEEKEEARQEKEEEVLESINESAKEQPQVQPEVQPEAQDEPEMSAEDIIKRNRYYDEEYDDDDMV